MRTTRIAQATPETIVRKGLDDNLNINLTDMLSLCHNLKWVAPPIETHASRLDAVLR